VRDPNFNWREGNAVELLVDGTRFYPAMLAAIEAARDSLMLEFYLAASGVLMTRFIEALSAAAGRGVRVLLLFDHYGARYLSRANRQQLSDAGVELVFYNPLALHKWFSNFSRDHRKLLIVDQRIAFIGGAGLTDHYWLSSRRTPQTPWHELMCRLEGPAVHDLVILFMRLWKRCTGAWPLQLQPLAEACGTATVRVMTVAGPSQQRILFSVLRQISESQRRVWICTAYFLPSFALRLALRRAARRGIDVRLLVAGPLTDHRWIHHASKRYYRRLLNAGVRLYEYQPRMLHAKAGVIDERVSIGSCNLDHWNLRWNLEANIEVCEPAFTRRVEAVFAEDFSQSQEITADQWARRPWHRKLKEWVWALVSQWILRIR